MWLVSSCSTVNVLLEGLYRKQLHQHVCQQQQYGIVVLMHIKKATTIMVELHCDNAKHKQATTANAIGMISNIDPSVRKLQSVLILVLEQQGGACITLSSKLANTMQMREQ
jgi:hypothetical protein